MTTAATIVSLKGEAFARTASGGMRRLAQGDTIQVGEVLITSLGAEVGLKTADGQTINVGGQESLGFGPESAAGTAPGAAEAAVAGTPAPTAVAPQEGIDVEQILEQEAAAAGLAGGGENSGNSFVRLLRIVEEINPLAYEFPNPIENEILPAGPGNQNSLPTAGDLTISLDEDDVNPYGYDTGAFGLVSLWLDDFETFLNTEALPGLYFNFGNEDLAPGDDLPREALATMGGRLNFSYGPDGVGDIQFNLPTTLTLTSGGQAIQYWLSADGHSLVGYVIEQGYSREQPSAVAYEGENGFSYAKVIFSANIVDKDTGEFRFTLWGALDHPDTTTEDNLVIPLGFTVTDGNGDSATGTLNANIDDDSPVLANYYEGEDASINAFVQEDGMRGEATGDESTGNREIGGSDWDDETDGQAYYYGRYYGALNNLVVFGADGQGSFSLDGSAGALNGLPTLYSQGVKITYEVNEDGTMLTASADDRTVFTLEVDPNGSWRFDLQDQLDHVDDGSNTENYALISGTNKDGSVTDIDFTSVLVATDYDGDRVDWGDRTHGVFTITVQDDIPVLDVGLYEAGEDTQYDGLPLLSTQDAETDGDPTETDTATASFAKFFTLSSSVGSDEPSETEPALVYSLSIGDSGGEDQIPGYTGLTSQGHPITLAMEGDDIVGSIMTTYGYSGVVSTPIFSISVDADTGVVTLSQYEQIDHLPEVADENNDNYEAYLPEGSIILTASASITDFDGDTASDSQALDISESFRFDDDVPTAEPDTNTVEEGAVLTVSAAAGVLANDALGADGATIYGVRAAEGDTDTPVSSGVGEDIDGEYGTLHLYADGSYTYTSWGDATDEDAVDTFVYTLKDGDNDLSTTTLEINVKDNSSMMISAWNDSQHTGEFEPTGDNKTATFTVTEAQIENNANATAWIGNLLKAGEAVPPAVVAAHPPLNTTLAVTSDITFTFISETAGFQNTVGWYDVNDPTVGYIVWANSSAAGSGGSLNPGSSTVTVNDVPAGTQIGFFMIPDAFSPDPGPANVPLDAGDKVYFNGGHAYRDAAYTQLINSTDNDMPGDADPVWFSNNTNLDGLQHVVTGLAQGEPTNLLYVGFEDLGGGGDRDYEDVIFKVDLGDGNNVVADPVVFNLGVDLPDAADLKSATIDFTLGDGDTIEWDVALAASLNLKVTQTDPDSYTIEAEDLLTGESGASFDELLDTFQINVGHTNAGDDYTKVDTDQRSAEVSVIDIYDNASNDVTALFNLTKVTPEP